MKDLLESFAYVAVCLAAVCLLIGGVWWGTMTLGPFAIPGLIAVMWFGVAWRSAYKHVRRSGRGWFR